MPGTATLFDMSWATTPSTKKLTIPAYLYSEYADDDNLQAFIDAYNEMVQTYVNTFNSLNLPVYTASNISGTLLDWVAEGIYGMTRPLLPSGNNKSIGPLNTIPFNYPLPLNKSKVLAPNGYYATSDDVFKRIMTWNFYKGDGKTFTIRWLKRRVMRFLTCANGTAGNISQTYQIGVEFGVGNAVSILIYNSVRTAGKSALPNTFAFNTRYFNQFGTNLVQYTVLPLASIFKSAVDAGVLQLPFQYSWSVTIIGS